jgi:repressor LexA
MTATPQMRTPGRPPVLQITEPQRRTLHAIEDYVRERGIPPTVQELADELGITPASAHDQIKQLERKGYLKREKRKARSLVVLRTADEPLVGLARIPLVGTVAAGQPVLADENILGDVLVDDTVARSGRCFGLRVQGDSMKNAGIRDGDLLVVRQQPLAEHGDIVVANVNGETTVKRLYLRGETIELRPENSKYRPVSIGQQEDFRIIGKVIAVHRADEPKQAK